MNIVQPVSFIIVIKIIVIWPMANVFAGLIRNSSFCFNHFPFYMSFKIRISYVVFAFNLCIILYRYMMESHICVVISHNDYMKNKMNNFPSSLFRCICLVFVRIVKWILFFRPMSAWCQFITSRSQFGLFVWV